MCIFTYWTSCPASKLGKVKNKRTDACKTFSLSLSLSSAVGLEPPPLSVSEERHLAILTELPFVVPFEERVKVQRSISHVSVRQIT